MAHVINSTQDSFSNVLEGFARAEKENYAFLWDVAVIGKFYLIFSIGNICTTYILKFVH